MGRSRSVAVSAYAQLSLDVTHMGKDARPPHCFCNRKPHKPANKAAIRLQWMSVTNNSLCLRLMWKITSDNVDPK